MKTKTKRADDLSVQREDDGFDDALDELVGKCEMRRPWTDREKAVVARYYNKVPVGEIAKRLKRSVAAVKQKGQERLRGAD